jgi:RsiW-degrading membrane proteinase PrsW (M82 family)
MISYKIVLIASLIGIIPVGLWLFLVSRSCQFDHWGKGYILKVIFVGVLTAVLAAVLEIIFSEAGSDNLITGVVASALPLQNSGLLLAGLVSAASTAFIEELSKGLGLLFLDLKNRIKRVNDGLILGVLVGLAFAITENGVYFAIALQSNSLEEIFQIVILRFILSTTAHVIYTGLMGYYLGKFFLSEERKEKIKRILQAFFIPFSIHFLFNFLLGTAYSWGVVLIIILGIFSLFRIYFKNKPT